MLTTEQRTLLENMLDASNRIFDRESKVVDYYALVVATAAALRGTAFAAAAELPIRELKKIVRSKASEEERRDVALTVSDGLVHLVASELRNDAKENPRRRHVV